MINQLHQKYAGAASPADPPTLKSNTVRGQGATDGDQLLRLDQIIGSKGWIPVSRSTWYAFIAQGRIKKPIMLGPRIACYWKSDVLAFIAELEVSNGEG